MHAAFTEAVVIAQVFAVIGSEDNDCVVQFVVLGEFCHDAADLVVNEGDGSVIVGLHITQQIMVDALIAVLVAVLEMIDPDEERLGVLGQFRQGHIR